MWIFKKVAQKAKFSSDTEHSKTRVLLFFQQMRVLFYFGRRRRSHDGIIVSRSLLPPPSPYLQPAAGPSLVRKGPGPSTSPKNRVARKTAVPNFFPPDQKFRRKKSSAKAFRFWPEMDRTDNGRSNQLNRRPRVGRDGREVLPEFGRFEKNGGRIYF